MNMNKLLSISVLAWIMLVLLVAYYSAPPDIQTEPINATSINAVCSFPSRVLVEINSEVEIKEFGVIVPQVNYVFLSYSEFRRLKEVYP